jgi:hypothetical protein
MAADNDFIAKTGSLMLVGSERRVEEEARAKPETGRGETWLTRCATTRSSTSELDPENETVG